MKLESATLKPARGASSLSNELVQFGIKQVMACLFALLFLVAIILTRNSPTVFGLVRADFLFIYAISIQVLLIVFRLEHWREVIVILTFHLLACFMEWFKTSPEIGSWRYPSEGAIFKVYAVPLYAGFLYASVGSYIARAWRLFEFRFSYYPPVIWTFVLAVSAYLNFYIHHYTFTFFGKDIQFDFRWLLIAVSLVLFWKCKVYFKSADRYRKMPILVALFSVAFLIWIAENIGTYAKAWYYPNQENGWELVPFGKFSSWYLLMMLSFVLVSLVQRKTLRNPEQ